MEPAEFLKDDVYGGWNVNRTVFSVDAYVTILIKMQGYLKLLLHSNAIVSVATVCVQQQEEHYPCLPYDQPGTGLRCLVRF